MVFQVLYPADLANSPVQNRYMHYRRQYIEIHPSYQASIRLILQRTQRFPGFPVYPIAKTYGYFRRVGRNDEKFHSIRYLRLKN